MVRVITGTDRGKTGKVLRVFPRQERVVVDGLNIRKRHVRAKKSGQKGEVIQFPAPLHNSNVQLVCGACGKATRVGYRVSNDSKGRICKKCGSLT